MRDREDNRRAVHDERNAAFQQLCRDDVRPFRKACRGEWRGAVVTDHFIEIIRIEHSIQINVLYPLFDDLQNRLVGNSIQIAYTDSRMGYRPA